MRTPETVGETYLPDTVSTRVTEMEASCDQADVADVALPLAVKVEDPATLSNWRHVACTEMEMSLVVDFARTALTGNVKLTMVVTDEAAVDVFLDTAHLDIAEVTVDGACTR